MKWVRSSSFLLLLVTFLIFQRSHALNWNCTSFQGSLVAKAYEKETFPDSLLVPLTGLILPIPMISLIISTHRNPPKVSCFSVWMTFLFRSPPS